jgi:hypothetical protein
MPSGMILELTGLSVTNKNTEKTEDSLLLVSQAEDLELKDITITRRGLQESPIIREEIKSL